MSNDELYAEILWLCLFDKNRRENPGVTFHRRLNDGDYLPLQPDEDPDGLPLLREPMDKVGLVAAREQAELDSMYLAGNTWLSTNGVISSVILRS